ncbi:MAG: LytTR family transcriptional regulator DNA-binding domain-containing protein [Clostridia bacterium]|nr:LytTR family transcriptional regulator DNA-binding domain-containing protein [Clostridia bacterium]
MKIRTEICDSEEIVIRCRERNERVRALESAIETAVKCGEELALTDGSAEYFVSRSRILFFESSEGKVYAHTIDRIYKAPYKLFELELMMPPSFVRISKSAIVNITHIESMRREIVGNGELTFKGCDKRLYFSRNYFKLLQYKIEEMRLGK